MITDAPAGNRVEESASSLARTISAISVAGDRRRFLRRLADLDARAESALGAVEACAACTSLAAEWLLDNRHIILGAVAQVVEDLTGAFFEALPKTDVRGEPRIEVIARELTDLGKGYVDRGAIHAFFDPFQRWAPLHMSELWALPSFLRLAVLESVVEAALELAEGPDVAGVDADRVSTAIACLRVIDQQDWKAVFEELSVVDATLRLDPAGVYPRMDFETRDRYRKAVEDLALGSGSPEWSVADEAVARAREATGDARHVGHHLIGPGRVPFEAHVRCHLRLRSRLKRRLYRHAGTLYFSGIVAGTFGLAALAVAPLVTADAAWLTTTLVFFLATVATSSVAVAVMNFVATRVVPPRVLPKLVLADGMPDELRTCVVVPAMLTDTQEVESVVAQMETSYLGNGDRNLIFALLADPPDAPRERESTDAAILDAARSGIRSLNQRHGEGRYPFLLFHRKRRWNEAEGTWMAWERKRGKLHEFNRFVLGANDTGLVPVEGDPSTVRSVRFVLTLDADTHLPRGAAARLVGTLAHPLNRPRVGPDGRIVSGYTVLQPRVETLLDERPSWFARILEADEGLDLYSHAVSDVYQDLFGEGIYAGKGLYDVRAFEQSLEERVPENALLSHDLFEGVHGRTGLVSDVRVLEGFPSHPLAYERRLHRWIRGDWQLLPWLFWSVPAAGGRRVRNRLPWTAQWKIADNLRRSLLAPALLIILFLGWLGLPGSAWWWSGMAGVVLAVPVLLSAVAHAHRMMRRRDRQVRLGPTRWAYPVARWAVAVAFLAWEGVGAFDAIIRTLFRLTVTHRHLLEWTPAAHTSRLLRAGGARLRRGLVLAAGPAVALAVGIAGIASAVPLGPAILIPLGAWLATPVVAWALARSPGPRDGRPPSQAVRRRLRLHARRTWAFFERFVGPEDHWLPPDHVQFDPPGGPAHRTSPTNIGLAILSVQIAYDLGYVTLGRLIAQVSNALDSLDRLERHRGHFLNWYDTQRLSPLSPRYVSTVDSGNLAASLIVVREAARSLGRTPVPRRVDVTGLADGLEVAGELLATAARDGARVLERAARELVSAAREARAGAPRTHELTETLQEVERTLARVEDTFAEALPRLAAEPAAASEVRWWLETLTMEAHLLRQELAELQPWLRARTDAPVAYRSPEAGRDLGRAWQRFLASAPDTTPVADVPDVCAALVAHLDELDELLAERAREDPLRATWWTAATEWNRELRARLDAAARWARRVIEDLAAIERRIDVLLGEMDFSFLYDPLRRLLHVGYDVDSASLDRSYYDLYASEARLASFIAIAKGDVPDEHWLSLARPFGRRAGGPVLLSWGGTMFEYLLPSLFVRMPEGSLAALACRTAVAAHMAYARQAGIPWGISESAYAELDSGRRYRYRAFGVPEIALHRDSTPRRVVAPYASALAMPVRTNAAAHNLRLQEHMGLMGPVGFFDAIDFGPARDAVSEPTVVRTVMAHHQGMVLGALHHVLTNGMTVDRFHSASDAQALEYLLHERPPALVRPLARLRHPPRAAAPLPETPGAPPWPVDPEAFPPEATVLSNGRLSSLVTAVGGGGIRWNGRDVTRWRADPTRAMWGTWIYVLDRDDGALTSAARAPTWRVAERDEVVFGEESVEFHRDVGDLRVRTVVTVASGADVEIRRVGIVNEASRTRSVDVTTFAEASLARPSDDRRHPAFAKLFVEADFHPASGTLWLAKRVEGLDEEPLFVGHRVVTQEGRAYVVGCEADRERFLGRLGDPRSPPGALDPSLGLRPRGPWAPLDPILSLTARVSIPARGETTVTFLTAVGATREVVRHALAAYRSDGSVTLALEQARDRERRLRQRLGISPSEPREFQRLLSLLVHPYQARGRPLTPGTRLASRQEVLWSLGVSGDRPLVTVTDARPGEGEGLVEVLRAHRYLREHGVELDLVVVGREPDGYGEPVRTWVEGELAEYGRADLLGASGGVHYVSSRRLGAGAQAVLEDASCLVFDGSAPGLAAAVDSARDVVPELPVFVAVPSEPPTTRTPVPVEERGALEFFNGWGGFDPSGHEYVVRLSGAPTPAPWANVLANPRFGTLVTESGGGFTWDANSGEARITPWSNDPVLDPPGEIVYVRDEETGEVWTPTPSPAGIGPHQVKHRADATEFLSGSHGLVQRMRVHVPMDARVKVTALELTNHWPRQRRLTVTCYVEWALGPHRWITSPHVVTGFREPEGVILAENRFSWASGLRYAYLASDAAVHGFTCDRAEFLGHTGDPGQPAGLVRIGLAGASGARLDPCGALQVHVDLAPGESRTVRFFLGAVDEPAELADVLASLRSDPGGERAGQDTKAFWDGLLGTTTVRTPERAMDLLVNRWGLHQTLASRIWGRTGFYQSSGAFGFRDQLQDVMALVGSAPELCREHILVAARHQFEEGDVLHWWHPPADRGVRTRCSDDRLWLPWVTARCVRALGPNGILDRKTPFLIAPPLTPDEAERYDAFTATGAPASVLEHCLRALDVPDVLSPRGIPLIRHGDWNDGLNRVGVDGRGESFWLSWFLYATLVEFAAICEGAGSPSKAADYRRRAEALREAAETHAWDG
ncbi:MAG TPA: glucoamylase family protein, partial [Longimicrobiales bacterium]|nr:glucoamylase family protein [Longimicrobiales bacterium]